MKNNILFLMMIVLIMNIFGCSNDDYFDSYVPEKNYYAVQDGETGPEAELRRKFFNDFGTYLLFNDTLGVRERPTLSGGYREYVIMDPNYNMTTTSGSADSLVFKLIGEYSKKEMAEQYLRNYIMSPIPEFFYPYSILLIEGDVEYFEYWYDNTYRDPIVSDIYFGAWSVLLSMDKILNANEVERDEVARKFVVKIIASNSYKLEEELKTFYSYCLSYYGNKNGNSLGYEDGIVDYDNYGRYLSKDEDFAAYITEILTLTKVEFVNKYGEYQSIMLKMQEIVNVLNNHGFEIYK